MLRFLREIAVESVDQTTQDRDTARDIWASRLLAVRGGAVIPGEPAASHAKLETAQKHLRRIKRVARILGVKTT